MTTIAWEKLRSPTISLPLDYDCLLAIIKVLEGDYQSLGRLLQVSKNMFDITAPILYGQLFKDPNAYSKWPDFRFHQLGLLLMTSSGFVEPPVSLLPSYLHVISEIPTNKGIASAPANSENDSTTNAVRLPLSTSNRNNTIPSFPCFGMPCTINYFSLLSRIPEEGFLSRMKKKYLRNRTSWEFQLFHASKIDTLSLGYELEVVLKNIHRFSNLKKLTVEIYYTQNGQSMNRSEMTEQFIREHLKLFPGVLSEFSALSFKKDSWLPLTLEMNEIIQPTTMMIRSDAFQGFGNETDLIKNPTEDGGHLGIFKRIKTLSIKDIDSILKRKISAFMPPLARKTLHDIGIFLQYCKKLQTLDLQIETPMMVSWEKAFLSSRMETDFSTGMTMNIRPQGLEIKRIRFLNTAAEGLYAALDQLRNSIERIEFVGLRPENHAVSWNWVLSKLTFLKLEAVTVDLRSLQYCTELEELVLKKVLVPKDDYDHDKFWTPPPARNFWSMTLIQGDAWAMLNQSSLSGLKSLRQLTMMDKKRSPEVERMMTTLDIFSWSTMNQLQDLSISAGPFQAFGLRKLLYLMPNLRRLGLSHLQLNNDQFDFEVLGAGGGVESNIFDTDVDTDIGNHSNNSNNNNLHDDGSTKNHHNNEGNEKQTALARLPSLGDLARVSKIEILDIFAYSYGKKTVENLFKALEKPVISEEKSTTVNATTSVDVHDTEVIYDVFPNLCILGLGDMDMEDDRFGPYLKILVQRPRISFVHFHYLKNAQFVVRWLEPLDPNLSWHRGLTFLNSLEEFDEYMLKIGEGFCRNYRDSKLVRTRRMSKGKEQDENEDCVFTSTFSVGERKQYRLKK